MREISAGGVVYRIRDGVTEVQLIRDRYGKMTLAKGKMEPGETIPETALREIREETGITGVIVAPLERVEYQYTHVRHGLVDKEVHYYLVEATGGELQAQLEEIDCVEWLNPQEAWEKQKQYGYGNNDSVLQKALAALREHADAAQSGVFGESDSFGVSGESGASGVPHVSEATGISGVSKGAGASGESKGTGVSGVSEVAGVPNVSSEPGASGVRPEALPAYIDHTLLKTDATPEAIMRLCDEARRFGFYSVCVNSGWVPLCRRVLEGSGVRISAVVGFPLGAALSEVKAFEAARAAAHGAVDIDMVLNVGALLAGDESTVRDDIRAVVEAVKGSAIVKVILETGYLNEEQKRAACRLAEEAGAHFVKTSTGFGPGGATVEDVRLMRASVSPAVQVKASGGVRDTAAALAMIEAGATRLGTSSGVAIVTGAGGAAPAP